MRRAHDSATEQAFRTICDQAIDSNDYFVSLYQRSSFYGGPEEGGWWGHDVSLVATQRYPTEDQAQAAKTKLEKLRDELNRDARAYHGDLCLSQLEACGWDAEDAQHRFGEVDGPDDYFVTIEQNPGSQAYEGNRHYE